MQKIKNVLSGDSTSSHGSHSGSVADSGVNRSSSLSQNSPTSTTTGANTGSTGANTGSLSTSGPTAQRAEETLGNRNVTGKTGDFADPHSLGHDASIASKFDPSAATTHHDHKHLNHVTQKDVRHVEVEEVQRQKEHERHVHHVQHHVQPVLDKQENDEVHHHNSVPVTNIREQHVNTDEDKRLFQGLATKHQDTETHRAKERTVVDLGEQVHENVHHHVHHVTQPVVQQEVVDRHRIHTVIPTQHVTHEAPIIHKSSVHEPVQMGDFLSGGGKLGSGITHQNAGVLQEGECERSVDGVGEKLAQDLNLKSGTMSGQHAGETKI